MSGKEKENTPLQQTSLNFSTGAPGAEAEAAPRGKKRTLSLKADVELNLDDANIPATREVVEAMRKRILELEEALESQPTAKRSKMTKPTEEEPKAGPSTSTASTSSKPKPKVDAKKIDAIVKKFWTSLQKEVKTEKYKFRGGPPKNCRVEEVIEYDEFLEILERAPKARIVQPLPHNKPNSSVTIIQYDAGDVVDLFGKHFKELKGNRYSLGGICARFAKGQKIGLVSLDINALELSYAKNTMKCVMKFEVKETNPYRCGLDEDCDGFYANYDYLKFGLV